jgi:uncharacterized protein (TIGR00251 family)
VNWLQQAADGSFVLNLHIQPGAKRSEIAGLHGDALKIRLAAPPVEGRANAALIAFLAEQLHVPKAAVSLEAGASSRRKRVRIEGADAAALAAFQQRVGGDSA